MPYGKIVCSTKVINFPHFSFSSSLRVMEYNEEGSPVSGAKLSSCSSFGGPVGPPVPTGPDWTEVARVEDLKEPLTAIPNRATPDKDAFSFVPALLLVAVVIGVCQS